MSKLDSKFLDNLQQFTLSLENICELLKEKQKQNSAGGTPTDLINDMLSNLPSSLAKINENLISIKNDTSSIKSDTKSILSEIKSLKKQKETGIFDKIEDKGNKQKIIDSTKSILLIATSVLAIGMAFKLVGNVNILSVIGISIGILTIAYAFDKLSKIKNLTLEKVLLTTAILPIMALGIVLSSEILNKVKILTLQQGVSAIFIGTALGLSAYGIMHGLSGIKVDKNLLASTLLLPLLLPALAAGIVGASMILQFLQPISLMTILQIGLLGLALGISLYIYSLASPMISKIIDGDNSLKKLGISLLAYIGLAGALVVASYILQEFKPLQDPLGLIIGSVSISIAVLAMSIPLLLISKISPKDLLVGSLGLVLISAAILASATILGFGDYTNFPSMDWVLNVSIGIMLLSIPVVALGLIATSGVGAVAILLGLVAIVAISGTMLLVDKILSAGSFTKFPSMEYSKSLSLSLLSFSTAAIILGAASLVSFGLVISAGLSAITDIAKTLVSVDKILSAGSYTKYPTEEFAKGVGLSILYFSQSVASIYDINTGFFSKAMDGDKFCSDIKNIARAIIAVSEIFDKSNASFDVSKLPSTEWSERITMPLYYFSQALVSLTSDDRFWKLNKSASQKILDLAQSIIDVGVKFNESKTGFDITKLPSEDYSIQLGEAIYSFALIAEELSKSKIDLDDFTDFIEDIGWGLVYISKKLNENKGGFDIKSVPSEAWNNALAKTIEVFKKAQNMGDSIDNILLIGKTLSKIGDRSSDINDLTTSLEKLSKVLDNMNTSSIEKLSKLSTGILTISIIDDQKLAKMIDTLKDKSAELSMVLSENYHGTINKKLPKQQEEANKVKTISPIAPENYDEEILDQLKTLNQNFALFLQSQNLSFDKVNKNQTP